MFFTASRTERALQDSEIRAGGKPPPRPSPGRQPLPGGPVHLPGPSASVHRRRKVVPWVGAAAFAVIPGLHAPSSKHPPAAPCAGCLVPSRVVLVSVPCRGGSWAVAGSPCYRQQDTLFLHADERDRVAVLLRASSGLYHTENKTRHLGELV